jgi:predicted 2-oxoglutarate/Fe(II)-dependent dioxygenase YbiX
MSAIYLAKGKDMKLASVNENLSIQKYVKGQGTLKKIDTGVTRISIVDESEYEERSFISIVIFLNDMNTKGGELKFYEWHDDPFHTVRPALGKCILFIHSQHHEHAPV